MKFHGKFFRRFGWFDTPEILQSLLNKIGIELSDEEAESIFKVMDLQKKEIKEKQIKSEMEFTPFSEEELAMIAGGKGDSKQAGSYVGRRCSYYGQTGTITASCWGTNECGNPTFYITVQLDTGRIVDTPFAYVDLL